MFYFSFLGKVNMHSFTRIPLCKQNTAKPLHLSAASLRTLAFAEPPSVAAVALPPVRTGSIESALKEHDRRGRAALADFPRPPKVTAPPQSPANPAQDALAEVKARAEGPGGSVTEAKLAAEHRALAKARAAAILAGAPRTEATSQWDPWPWGEGVSSFGPYGCGPLGARSH